METGRPRHLARSLLKSPPVRTRLPSWILLAYVAIDFANPFVPGAFRFTAENGLVWMEGMPQLREGTRVSLLDAKGPARPVSGVAPGRSLLVPGQPTRVEHFYSWPVGIRTGDPPARDSPPCDTDDH
jgi:hypothetical protein